MKTIFVDDELWMLKQFKTECSDIPDIEMVGEFTSAEDALEYALNNPVEFALLDIEMPGMNGVELARELRKLNPDVIIVFVSAHSEYLADFINIKADYYVIKPYERQDILDVIKRAKLLSGRFRKRIFIRTFGSFDVFLDGRPVYFRAAKAKELLALMVDKRGAILTSQEALSRIWEGRSYDSNSASVYRVNMKKLKDILKEEGLEEILVDDNKRGKYLDTTKFDCDLYDFLDGDRKAINSFSGEYMREYSWAEPRTGYLQAIKDEYTSKRAEDVSS